MHRIRENCPATCAALPVHGCEDRADHVGSTGNVIAHPRKGGNERGCVSDRSMHGAWSQPTTTSSLQLTHPRVRKTHTTRRSTPHSPLASGQMETSSDPVSASLGWCCVCMAQIFPRSHQARVSTRLTRVVFQLPKIIQADHDAKMVEGEPTQ
ncbi:hypothetical protein VNO80_32391 [Phaseolus coccineus]|uniref:Uncharacterized protein n=1 Tax=Phaseolus coccineus TaxID=3886 RepID=A0AAN9KZC0_PHACN